MSDDKLVLTINTNTTNMTCYIRGEADRIADQIAEPMIDNNFIVFDLYKGGKLILNKANIVWLEIKIPPTS